MKRCKDVSRADGGERSTGRRVVAFVVLASGLGLSVPLAHAARYGFETGVETWEVLNWNPGVTNVSRSSFWAYAGTNSLKLDCDLTADGDKGWAGVTFDPQNVTGSQIAMRAYCPSGASGANPESWAWTQLRLWVKDSHYNYQETAWDSFTIPPGVSTQLIAHTVTAAGGFDPTNVIQFGLQIYWRGFGAYHGSLYIDEAGFGAAYQPEVFVVHSNDLRYGFESSKEGWGKEVYVDPDPRNSLTGIVGVAQSTNQAIEGTRALQLDVQISQSGTNRQKGAATVDMRWYPPPEVRTPFDLEGTAIYAYVYCPTGTESGVPGDANVLKLVAKSSVDGTNWFSQIGAPVAMKDGQWVELKLVPDTNTPANGYTDPGFTPTSIVALGVAVDMCGTYNGPIYLDNICFGLPAEQVPQTITNSQHHYDFEAASQSEWWTWGTNPDGWNAKAWTNTFYATNAISGSSVALAANAAFRTNDSSEVVTNEQGQVVTNEFTFQKGVFEIAYQPALNLSTKDHRRIQAKLRFEPPVEGLLAFDASVSVFDKVTDQWYAKSFKVGGSGWNWLTFDLDQTNEYTSGAPVPMLTEAIGFITIQLFANLAWTGTVYLEDVVVGGRESGTNYNLIAGAFVEQAGHKFVVGGSNFYHCGANIEYLQTVPDATVRECLDWASSNQIAAVRTWAMQEGKPYSFQPQRGVWNELMFEHLDRIVAEAGHRGIRLMLDLVDNWAHNGGVFQYVHWVVKEHPETVNTNLNKEGVLYHDQFWTNTWCKQWYKEYVTRLLNRTNSITGRVYKNDPTIFALEIVNEPRCESDFGGRTIHDWLHEMSDFVRSVDTNHLLGPGEEGGYINTYDFAERIEWINDHWYDSHSVIGKPMILEEFGIHAIGWVFNGSYGQVQLRRTPEYTLQDRVNIYSQYYGHIENSGISGSFFWNFGYAGMWNDPFHHGEAIEPWAIDPGYGCATSIVLSQEYVIERSNSLKLCWNYTGAGVDRAIFKCVTNEEWVLRVDRTLTNEPPTHGINRTKLFWNFYNPGPADQQVALAISGGPNWDWCESPPQTLTQGWNKILFDLSAGTWAWLSNGWQNSEYLINIPNAVSNVLEDVHQVSLVFRDLPVGPGACWIDDIQIKRDDGFVIYADDPVNPVIKAHAIRMNARNIATNHPANHAPVASNVTALVHPKNPSPVTLGAGDADGDPISYRIRQKPQHGWIFGTPPNMTYTPMLGYEGPDSFTYLVHDGLVDSAEAVVTIRRAGFDHIRFDFLLDAEGWYANATEWTGYAVTSVVWTTENALHGASSLRANVKLAASPHDAGDAEVNMEATPPPHLVPPADLNGQRLEISVFCPVGSRGLEANPNRIQIYAKDTSWRAEYTIEANLIEDQWITYSMIVSTNTPPGGWTDAGFDPSQIRAIGVRVKHGGAGSEYTGPIFVDAASFPMLGRNLYGFDQGLEGWSAEDFGSGDATLAWTNTLGVPGAGALRVTPVSGASYGKFLVKDGSLIDNQDLIYNHILQCYVFVPADAPSNLHHAVRVRLYLRSSSDGWSYDNKSEEIVLVPGRWNLVRWDMSGVPPDVLRDADEFALEIIWPERDVWQGPVYVDSLNLLPQEPELAPQITGVTAATNTVGRYRKFEVTVGIANVAGLNPYDPNNVDLRATFKGPDDSTWTINGFYMEDGGAGQWTIRFAPNQAGTWTYKVSARNARGASAVSNLSFACVASDRHGWLRVSDDDGHYLEQDDDTPFIGKGYCHPWDGDDEGVFANCEEHGINMIHWWLAPWDTMLTVLPANPEETWRDKSSYDTYHQARAAKVDRVVGYAEKHNVKLVFTLWPHDAIRDFNHHKWRINGSWAKAFDQKTSEPEWYINAFSELDHPPKNQKFFHDKVYKEYQNRLYRYIIARWGYSEAIGSWALVSELFGTFANSANCIDYQGQWAADKNAAFGEDPYLNLNTNQCDGNDYTIPWVATMNGFFKTNDPFRHPTTASYATDEYWPEGFDIVDIPQIHVYADLYNWITPPVTVAKYHHELFKDYNKPALMGEIGTVEWKTYEPDYTRVTAWPALCAGAPITPMMWTTPAFSWFGDAKMGPWYDAMSDEMKVISKFTEDIAFHRLALRKADCETKFTNEPPETLVESFEGGMHDWATWGPAIAGSSIVTQHATQGTNALRLDIDMDTFAHMPVGVSGIQKYEGDGFAYNWSNYWPRGTIKMDVYIPEFYHADHNPDGFLLGINKDPRSIVEVFTKDEQGDWHWYSTTNEYGGAIREKDGWKKLTVGMLWNLELDLKYIPTAYEAAHIVGLKFWFGDVGILRGPIYIDHITAGLYAFNTYGMVASNGAFGFGWIQDRTWTNGVIASNAVFQMSGLAPGVFNVEWWSPSSGIIGSFNANAPTGTLRVTVPPFNKDLAVKVRRIGVVGTNVHDVAIANVREYDWVVKTAKQVVDVLVANRGTAPETFAVTLTDATSGLVCGTNTITLAAGAVTNTLFFWNNLNGPYDVFHTLVATASAVRAVPRMVRSG